MSAPAATGFLANARAVLVLGLPLVGSHVAQFLLHVTDTIMLGWYTVTDLAAGALGATVFFVVFTLGMGFAQAVMPMVATAAAAGDDTEVRRVTRMGIWLSMAFAVLALPLFLFSAPLLARLGQEPDVARVGGGYLSIVGFGLVPALVAMVLKSYLAALGRTQVVLWATIAGVFVNIAVNWLLIFGNLGFPEMGARGAAVASVLVQVVTLSVMLAYAVSLPALRHYQLLVRFWRPDWTALRRVNALGLPIGPSAPPTASPPDWRRHNGGSRNVPANAMRARAPRARRAHSPPRVPPAAPTLPPSAPRPTKPRAKP